MLEILSAAFGFLAPFVTELFKIVQRKQDNSHELAVLELQGKIKQQEHTYRMEELSVQADIKEVELVHQPSTSFGVQILDAAKNNNLSNLGFYPAFYLFVLLDFISSLVRPTVTYAAFTFYAAVKWAQLQVAIRNATMEDAILKIWTDSDMAIVILVLSYWFGQRAVKAAFGGSANTAYRGQ